MAPRFLVRKSEKKEVYEDELSASEESVVDGLKLDTPTSGRKRRTRSFLDRVPSSLNLSTDSLAAGSNDATPRPPVSADASPSSAGSFLSAVNNLLRSPRSAVESKESSNSLKPPTGRPRARTAPSTPSFDAINADPIELPAHVPSDDDSKESPENECEGRKRQESDDFPGSSWFRVPKSPGADEEARTPTISELGSKDVSPKTIPQPKVAQQAMTPGYPGLQQLAPAEKPRQVSYPGVRKEVTPPRASQPPPQRPYIPMPSWPVSGTHSGLLGPIPPGAGPAPQVAHFPLLPRTPFFAPPRANSVPVQPAPPPPPSPGSELTALRNTHTSYVASLNDAHAQELSHLADAHEREVASLRTHIALLENKATLPQGQHLSPSGLLPLLNTSPTPTRNGSDATNTSVSVHSITQPATSSPGSFDTALEDQRRISNEAALEVDALKTTLKRRDTEFMELQGQRDVLQQTLDVKERKVAQMKSAMTRAAEKENGLKMKMADLHARLEAANDQRVDLQETLGEANEKARLMSERESSLLREVERLRVSVGTSSTTGGDSTGVDELNRRLSETEKEFSDLQIKVTVERDQNAALESNLSTARTELEAARSELSTAKDKIAELEKQTALSPLEQTGMITIANALGGLDGLSPIGARTSVIGRLDLLRREVRNLEFDERAELIAAMRRQDHVYSSDSGTQTDAKPAAAVGDNHATNNNKEKEKALKTTIRKIEGERDQLSALLSAEIRRAARASAKSEDLGLARLERYDSICSRVGTLRHKASSTSVDGSGRAAHAKCEEHFTKAKEMYEEEIGGLVKEIVLYKLDIKGYKKDLRRASSTISKLKKDPDDPDAASIASRDDDTATLRTRRSTTHLFKEKARAKEKQRAAAADKDVDAVARSASLDGLGITFGASAASTAAAAAVAAAAGSKAGATPRPGVERAHTFDASPALRSKGSEGRLDRKDSGLGGAARPVPVSAAGKDKGKKEVETEKEAALGRMDTMKSERSVAQSIISSYGKDRTPLLPLSLDVEGEEEEELRPLSTVAEVGSAVGSAV